MALQEFLNKKGIPLLPLIGGFPQKSFVLTSSVQDAAGESTAFIGHVLLEGGVGSSKTISSAGGKIHWIATNTNVFSNAGTTIRVGIQDVASTGFEDGTFDVYQDLVGGTDTITSGVLNATAMDTGTKTITHGDLIAVVIEMTARGGADSVRPGRVDSASGTPYSTTDVGAGPSKSASTPCVVIEFDDGTVGGFGEAAIPFTTAETAFNSSSVIDEYAVIFSIPFKAATNELTAIIGEIDATETGQMHLYSDPLGTPVAERTVEVDPEEFSTGAATTVYSEFRITEFTLEPNTLYAISYRPTTTATRNIRRITGIPTANSRRLMALGTNFRGGTRADNTGAFAETTTEFPMIGCVLNKLDDGVSSGGGTVVVPFSG